MSTNSDAELATALADGSFEAFSPISCTQLECKQALSSQDNAASPWNTQEGTINPGQSDDYQTTVVANGSPEQCSPICCTQFESTQPLSPQDSAASAENTQDYTINPSQTTDDVATILADGSLDAWSPIRCTQLDSGQALSPQDSAASPLSTQHSTTDPEPPKAAHAATRKPDSHSNVRAPRAKRHKKATNGLIDLTVHHIYIDLTRLDFHTFTCCVYLNSTTA